MSKYLKGYNQFGNSNSRDALPISRNHDMASRGCLMHPCLVSEQALTSIDVDVFIIWYVWPINKIHTKFSEFGSHTSSRHLLAVTQAHRRSFVSAGTHCLSLGFHLDGASDLELRFANKRATSLLGDGETEYIVKAFFCEHHPLAISSYCFDNLRAH